MVFHIQQYMQMSTRRVPHKLWLRVQVNILGSEYKWTGCYAKYGQYPHVTMWVWVQKDLIPLCMVKTMSTISWGWMSTSTRFLTMLSC